MVLLACVCSLTCAGKIKYTVKVKTRDEGKTPNDIRVKVRSTLNQDFTDATGLLEFGNGQAMMKTKTFDGQKDLDNVKIVEIKCVKIAIVGSGTGTDKPYQFEEMTVDAKINGQTVGSKRFGAGCISTKPADCGGKAKREKILPDC